MTPVQPSVTKPAFSSPSNLWGKQYQPIVDWCDIPTTGELTAELKVGEGSAKDKAMDKR